MIFSRNIHIKASKYNIKEILLIILIVSFERNLKKVSFLKKLWQSPLKRVSSICIWMWGENNSKIENWPFQVWMFLYLSNIRDFSCSTAPFICILLYFSCLFPCLSHCFLLLETRLVSLLNPTENISIIQIQIIKQQFADFRTEYLLLNDF